MALGFELTSRDPDPQEVLRLKRVPFAEALARVLDGSVRDAGTIAMLSLADAAGARGALPPELARRIAATHR